MQYAEVVPNTKTNLANQTFTYKIHPEILPRLKIGSLVLIPFHNRKIEGIILNFHKTKMGIEETKLKKITEIIHEEPVIDKSRLELAKWMSQHYFAPLSLCLFEMTPLPPKRNYKIIPEKTLAVDQSDLRDSIIKLCQKVISKNKQVVILFPEIKQASSAYPGLQTIFKGRVVIYHGELNKSERFETWKKIKNKNFDIIIGSRIALFTPLSRLGLIIIQDENSESYKNDRTPRYDTKIVAEKLAKITESKLILISPTPSLESYYRARKSKKLDSKSFYLYQPLNPSPPTQTSIIDLRDETKKGNFSPISQSLKNLITSNFINKKRTILFVSRRGAASYLLCRDCGYVTKCPNCDLPLYYSLTDVKGENLTCHHCFFKTQMIEKCPQCQSSNIKFKGTGTQKIELEIGKILPKAKTFRIDKDTNPTENISADIIVATQKLFSYSIEPVDLTGIISIDSALNLPDFRQSERVLSTIYRLKLLTKRNFIIQTYHPNDFVIKNATIGSYQDFYKKEIQNREKLNFPPFCRLIRIIHQTKNEVECQKQIEILANKLKPLVSILGPSPCFYSKIRGKYRLQIVIKIPPQGFLKPSIRQLFNTLSSNWIIDVDPVTLL
ncbi:MAG: primosomal protein N' [Candidatus Berkelbacteria bacterium]|nr:primosomal protein N' [Candidatus Berkelbacteria bacterium]